jgi:hypothetical protein
MGRNGTVLRAAENGNLAFLPVQGHGWLQEVGQGRVSAVYGQAEHAIVLRFSLQAALPAEMVILLLPLEAVVDELNTLGTLTRLVENVQDDTVRGYCYLADEERHYMFFAGRNGVWKLGAWESDAEFLYCGVIPGAGHRWVLCGGSYAEIGGCRVISCRQQVDRYEWTSRGATKQIFCSDESAPGEVSEDALASAQTVLLGQGGARSPWGAL